MGETFFARTKNFRAGIRTFEHFVLREEGQEDLGGVGVAHLHLGVEVVRMVRMVRHQLAHVERQRRHFAPKKKSTLGHEASSDIKISTKSEFFFV